MSHCHDFNALEVLTGGQNLLPSQAQGRKTAQAK